MSSDVMPVRLHLRQVKVLGVVRDTPFELVAEVASSVRRPRCPDCGAGCSGVHDVRVKRVRDLEASGRAVTLLWKRRRLVCGECGRRFVDDKARIVLAMLRCANSVSALPIWQQV